MKKQFLLFLFMLVCTTYLHAETTLDRSFVTFTNNTNEKISIQTTLVSDDTDFKRGIDWDGPKLELSPYETKLVLWFTRLQHIKPNAYYYFNLLVSPANPFPTTLLVAFQEKGRSLFGSDLDTYLTIPNQAKQAILKQGGLEPYRGEFWDGQYTLYGLSKLPLGSLYNSFHLVIDKKQKTTLPTPCSKQMSVLSYNTQLMPFYAGVVDDLNQPNIRSDRIPSKIMDYDVVILQELFDRDLRNKIIKLMQAAYPYHTNVIGANTSRFLTGGVMIFSKWPILREDQIIYRNMNGIDSMAAKGALYASINKQGKIYHVIGTHLQAERKDASKWSREMQLHELAEFIGNLKIPASEPLLIGGDFNIDQFNAEVETLLNTLHVSLLDNTGYRYSTDSNVNTMAPEKYFGRIDYIFYSNDHAKPNLAFNKVFVLRDLDNLAMWPKFDLSDHFPVWGFFEFADSR